MYHITFTEFFFLIYILIHACSSFYIYIKKIISISSLFYPMYFYRSIPLNKFTPDLTEEV